MRLLTAVCICVMLAGCGWIYKGFGINDDGTVTPGGGIFGTAASVVNYFIPGVTAVAGAATTLLAAVKARNWKKAFSSTAEVIEAGAAAGKAVSDIKAELKVAHSAAGVGGIVDKVVQKIGS